MKSNSWWGIRCYKTVKFIQYFSIRLDPIVCHAILEALFSEYTIVFVMICQATKKIPVVKPLLLSSQYSATINSKGGFSVWSTSEFGNHLTSNNGILFTRLLWNMGGLEIILYVIVDDRWLLQGRIFHASNISWNYTTVSSPPVHKYRTFIKTHDIAIRSIVSWFELIV